MPKPTLYDEYNMNVNHCFTVRTMFVNLRDSKSRR